MSEHTHMHRAQPVKESHLLVNCAYISKMAWNCRKDKIRMDETHIEFGALAGNPFGIDRAAMVKELVFKAVLTHFTERVPDLEFVLETLQ